MTLIAVDDFNIDYSRRLALTNPHLTYRSMYIFVGRVRRLGGLPETGSTTGSTI